jgi:hypothetical protein
MKKNVIGILGIAVALVVAVLILSTEMMSPELVSVLMAGMIISQVLNVL